MTPPQLHISFEVLSSAGIFPISTVGAPGTQGAEVTGMQGMGVSTPNAVAVAVATVGLARDEHIPKGMTLTMGAWSMMVAAGTLDVTVLFVGSTINDDGATPNEHCISAPMQTS
jgi:hypothetical protein